LIPQPQKIEKLSDETFSITAITLGRNDLSNNAIEDFLAFCSLPASEKENIIFKTDDSLSDEEYIIETGKVISIFSNSASGQLYALQTLKQIIFQCKNHIPHIKISDKPAYKFRGFMLDVGRYFFSVEDVKKIIKRMVLHKLNVLHLHLTEDQGWRIEIEKYPLLTKIGSERKKTNFNYKPHSGFYTKQDIKDIVDYAHSFSIKVMPEFDIPGHSRAAIACYNDLTCFPRPLPVADHWGVKHDVLCVGKNSTMQFVYDVLDEFFEMFPDEYIHIGGDEVPKHRWDLCPACNAKRKELGLETSDALQFWFMNQIKDYCKEHGKQAFMWSWELEDDSMLDNDLGFTKCGDMDTKERPFIDTSTKANYIDLPYGYISLKDTADHKVFSGNALGVEGTLWTEYVLDMKKADLMSFPRTGCIAETGWNGNCSWDSFSDKLNYYYSYLDKNNIGYAKPSKANPNKLRAKLSILLFERRQLAWEGLHNIFDDKKIEKLAKRNR
ncbi:MAG: beta-N-acetylhexosaminidase, partial [Eubacterium sp.]|nr:beta-N-acetylhexosaminidase [Eubacterium sp.]